MTIRRATTALALSALLAGGTACSSGGSDAVPTEPVRLTVSGGCGDAYIWASTPKGDIAVTASVEARDRPTAKATTFAVEVPDEDVKVEVLHGKDLARNFCTDVIDGNAEPTATHRAIKGRGTLTLSPTSGQPMGQGCGQATGRLRLSGLVDADGTRFAPIDATTDQIGCYAG